MEKINKDGPDKGEMKTILCISDWDRGNKKTDLKTWNIFFSWT